MAAAAPPRPPGPGPVQCCARCSYIHDSFTPGCGITRARAQCANAATLQLVDPDTGQPIDAQNPHLQAKIDILDLAVRPRQGPIPVCPHHAGLVARDRAWATAGKAATVAAVATGAGALAYATKKAFDDTKPEKRLRDLLRQTLQARKVARLQEIRDRVQQGRALPAADRALLARLGLADRAEGGEGDSETTEGTLRRIREEDAAHAIREYAAAHRAWHALPLARRAACLRGCPGEITPAQRRLLRRPPAAATARVPGAAASARWAWEDAEELGSLWEGAKAWARATFVQLKGSFDEAVTAAARVATAVQDKVHDLTWAADPATRAFFEKTTNDARNELQLAMAQRDRYVYALGTMSLVEALTASTENEDDHRSTWQRLREAPGRLARGFNAFHQTRYYRKTPYARGVLAALKASESGVPTGRASYEQGKIFQDRLRSMGLLSARMKVPNWTPSAVGWGWLFDMQSNMDPNEVHWTPSLTQSVHQAWDNAADRMAEWWAPSHNETDPSKRHVSPWRSQGRADAGWMDTVEALFRVPPGAAAARAYVADTLRPQLEDMRRQIQREMDYSYNEMKNPVAGTQGLRGLDSDLRDTGMSRFRDSVVDTYRRDQAARHQWLAAMERQVAALLKDDSWLVQRSTTPRFDASWQVRDPAYQRG